MYFCAVKNIVIAILAVLSVCFSADADEPTPDLTSESLRIVAQADSAIAEHDWPLAGRLLEEAIGLRPGDPSNILLMSNLGVVRLQNGDSAGALEVLNDANAIAPSSVTILNNRAKVYLSMGQKEMAVADYERVMAIDSTLSAPYFYRGMVRFSHGDIAGAREDYERLKSLSPGSEDALLAMATLHTATGESEAAVYEFQELIKLTPAAEYYSGLIENRLAQDQYSEAAEDIAEAMRQYPVDPEFYILRAILNKRRYLYEEARADARRAVELGADGKQVNQILNSR